MERSDLEVAGEAEDGLDLLSLMKRLSPDMVILDISMPHLRGMEAISEIKQNHPDVKILVLTMHQEVDYLFQAISAGADGYLLKDDAERDLFFAIDTVLQGRVYVSRLLAEESRQDWAQIRRGERKPHSVEPLTTREREVLKLTAEGKSSKEIGDLLFISYRTVERHRSNIMSKLNLTKSADLVKYAIQKGYI
jgi:DNA-binding NarL/FixJ family response regulator